MKIFQVISWSAFLLGIIFKFLHFPGAGILCTLGFGLIFWYAIIFLCKNVFFKKENKEKLNALMYFAFAFLTNYILFRTMFWPGSVIIYICFALPITFIYFALFLVKKRVIKLPQISLLVYFAVSFFLYNIPTHQVYYFQHANSMNTWSSMEWNSYSWYLYNDGKYAEAIKANHKAQELILTEDYRDLDYRNLLHSCQQEIEQKILNRTWTDPDYFDCFLENNRNGKQNTTF